MSYHAKFGHSMSKGVGISRVPQKLWHAGPIPGMWSARFHTNMLSLWVNILNLIAVVQIQSVCNVYGYPPEELGSSHHTFQGCSRPSELSLFNHVPTICY